MTSEAAKEDACRSKRFIYLFWLFFSSFSFFPDVKTAVNLDHSISSFHHHRPVHQETILIECLHRQPDCLWPFLVQPSAPSTFSHTHHTTTSICFCSPPSLLPIPQLHRESAALIIESIRWHPHLMWRDNLGYSSESSRHIVVASTLS